MAAQVNFAGGKWCAGKESETEKGGAQATTGDAKTENERSGGAQSCGWVPGRQWHQTLACRSQPRCLVAGQRGGWQWLGARIALLPPAPCGPDAQLTLLFSRGQTLAAAAAGTELDRPWPLVEWWASVTLLLRAGHALAAAPHLVVAVRVVSFGACAPLVLAPRLDLLLYVRHHLQPHLLYLCHGCRAVWRGAAKGRLERRCLLRCHYLWELDCSAHSRGGWVGEWVAGVRVGTRGEAGGLLQQNQNPL